MPVLQVVKSKSLSLYFWPTASTSSPRSMSRSCSGHWRPIPTSADGTCGRFSLLLHQSCSSCGPTLESSSPISIFWTTSTARLGLCLDTDSRLADFFLQHCCTLYRLLPFDLTQCNEKGTSSTLFDLRLCKSCYAVLHTLQAGYH
jgi:hypothetical protein